MLELHIMRGSRAREVIAALRLPRLAVKSGALSRIACPALAIAIATAPFVAFASDEAGDEYLLGPQDRLMVRVHTLRRTVGEATPWASLTGEFQVGASGNLSMPIIGAVAATGISTDELSERISQDLKEAVGLTDTPSTSVEIIQYRPFFVLGSVQEPGRYEYQPGMTVLQALGTARGLLRAPDMTVNQRTGIDAQGELRTLDAERIDLLAKLARLEAETSDADTVTFPDELRRRLGEARVAQAISDEELRFDVRRRALAAEIDAIEQSKKFYEQEIETLRQKTATTDRQAELTAQELQTAIELVRRGVAVAPRQLAAESAQLVVENSRLDLQVAMMRAQQGLVQAERNLVELPARYRRESIDETVITRGLIAQNRERLTTADRVLTFVEEYAGAAALDDPRIELRFELTRQTAEGSVTQSAAQGDAIRPGDVLTVIVERPSRGTSVTIRETDGLAPAPRT